MDIIMNEKLEITDWTVTSITESEDGSEKRNGDESWKNFHRDKRIGECIGILKKSEIIHSEKSDQASDCLGLGRIAHHDHLECLL